MRGRQGADDWSRILPPPRALSAGEVSAIGTASSAESGPLHGGQSSLAANGAIGEAAIGHHGELDGGYVQLVRIRSTPGGKAHPRHDAPDTGKIGAPSRATARAYHYPQRIQRES